MEFSTSSYLIPTSIFSNNLRSKKPHFFPVSAASNDSNPSTTPPQKATPIVRNDTRIVTKARPIVAPAAAFVLSLQATFSHALKYLIDKFIGHRISFCFDEPRNVLPGNFAPVDELPPTRCPVVHGTIPSCLAGGAYIRNGPNPQFPQHGHGHHMYDGDGMLHSLLFSEDGDVKLCSRYVKTYSYRLEHDHGDIMMPKFFSGLNGLQGVASRIVLMARVLAGLIDPCQGIGMANTSVAIIGGCLYALGEPDLPYSVHVDPATGEISTIGRCDFEGQLAIGMTAHPKKDPVTHYNKTG